MMMGRVGFNAQGVLNWAETNKHIISVLLIENMWGVVTTMRQKSKKYRIVRDRDKKDQQQGIFF